MNQKRNLAARAGHWSAIHRKTAIWGWLAFVLLAVVIGETVGTKTLSYADQAVGESGRAEKAMENSFPQAADETVLIRSRNGTGNHSPGFQRTTAALADALEEVPSVGRVETPFRGSDGPGNPSLLSENGVSAMVTFRINGNDAQVDKRLDGVLTAVDRVRREAPRFELSQFGDASANRQVNDSISSDFQKAELSSLPVTLIILVLTFGAFIAAGVPLLLGATAVAGAIGITGLASHLVPVSDMVTSVILLIGLAVGVDYSLFYLRREREERASGRSERASLEAAAATSGRAVIISGVTVMIAMAGMYLTGSPVFSSFATGTIIVVAVAVLGSLTVLPATLAWLGDRVDRGRVPQVHRLWQGRDPGRSLGTRLIRGVLRRPLVSTVLAGGLLFTLAIPAFGLHTVVPGVEALPQDLDVIKAYDKIDHDFPGGPEPAHVVIEAGDVTDPAVREGIASLRNEVRGDGQFGPVLTSVTSDNGRVAVVDVPLAGAGTDEESVAALDTLRSDVIPQTIGTVPGTEVNVTGMTAGSEDFNDLMRSHAPLVFAFVLSAAFLLLLFAFRSVVIPAASILLNLLSVGVAYGLIVWIFQEGHLEQLLGFQSTGGITAWLPLFLFVVLFGLSMDYHVFILSRIREARNRGLDTPAAIETGLRRTAGPVNSAAIVMVAVFSIFATLSMVEFKQMGVGLAAAVFIDATIIRGVLVPATMKLLGRWNWYLPGWLEWLPRFDVEEPTADEGLSGRGTAGGGPAEQETADPVPAQS